MKLHHIGIAAKNLEKEISAFEKIGYEIEGGGIFIDEHQNIKGCFMEMPESPRLEILENLHPDGPLSGFLKRGIKMYHFAYEVNNVETQAAFLVKNRFAKIVSPVSCAAAFDKVCFLTLPNTFLIELVKPF